MAQFYATVTGQSKGTITKIGSKNSGLVAHVRGWHVGVKVVCETINGLDFITVFRTGGSKSPDTQMQLARIAE